MLAARILDASQAHNVQFVLGFTQSITLISTHENAFPRKIMLSEFEELNGCVGTFYLNTKYLHMLTCVVSFFPNAQKNCTSVY